MVHTLFFFSNLSLFYTFVGSISSRKVEYMDFNLFFFIYNIGYHNPSPWGLAFSLAHFQVDIGF